MCVYENVVSQEMFDVTSVGFKGHLGYGSVEISGRIARELVQYDF
jgi:hypothetical protein